MFGSAFDSLGGANSDAIGGDSVPITATSQSDAQTRIDFSTGSFSSGFSLSPLMIGIIGGIVIVAVVLVKR